MKFYSIEEDLGSKRTGRFEGTHRWCLPGIYCSFCGQTWSNVGISYPSIDFSGLEEQGRFMPSVVPLSTYIELERIVGKAFPDLPVLRPGTEFGPLVGRIVEPINDFAWGMPWTLLVKKETLITFQSGGLKLPNSVRPLSKSGYEYSQIAELEVLPYGRLINGVYEPEEMRICPTCHRDSAKMPERIVVDISTVPPNTDIFRVSNFSTLLLVSERFRDTFETHKLKGAIFRAVDLG